MQFAVIGAASDGKPRLRLLLSTLARPPLAVPLRPVPAPRPAPIARPAAAPSEQFWAALGQAKAAYNRSHDFPLPWVATPAKARRLRFRNQHGEIATVKQPAQFQCPPARFWPGKVIPMGVTAPPAAIDQTPAEYRAECARRLAACEANLDRTQCPDDPDWIDYRSVKLQDARALLRVVPLYCDRAIIVARLRAACCIAAHDLALADRQAKAAA